MTREFRNLSDNEEPTVKSIMDDHYEITELLVRYATGIDSRDRQLFRTCFTDDAHFDYGYLGTFENPTSSPNTCADPTAVHRCTGYRTSPR